MQNVRIAVISDIHGNRTAFEAVLSDLRKTSPDVVFHAGDLADGGSSPVEIVDQLSDLGWAGLIGNTDEMLSIPERFEEFARARPQLDQLWRVTRDMADFTRERLGHDRLQWLRQLPRQQVCDSVAVVHASPATCWTSPIPEATDVEFQSTYTELAHPIAIYGHIHLPFVRQLSNLTVANSGSVGMPFDGDPRASYLLITGTNAAIRRVEYDVEQEIRNLFAAGLPYAEWIAKILQTARPQMPD